MPPCLRCGVELTPPFQFCPGCGAPQAQAFPGPAYYPSPRNDHAVLIIVVVVVVLVLGSIIAAAVLYVMTSGLINSPGPSKPVVSFGDLSLTATSATFQVAGAVPVVSIPSYKFNLVLNGVSAFFPLSLQAGTNTITVNGTGFWVNYTDISGNGNLKSGDILEIQAQTIASHMPVGAYEFVLIWAADGSTIQNLAWNA